MGRLSYKFRIDVLDHSKSSMSLKYRRDLSVSLAVFFLKVVGFWLASNRVVEWFRNATVVYSVIVLFFSIWVQMRGLYFSWGDFGVCTYIGCNSLGLLMDLFKMFIIFMYKEKFHDLIIFMQKNFWHSNYDKYENSVIAHAKRMCVYFVCVFSFFSQSTVFCYMIRPIISNIGKNETDRSLIFNMWLDLPLSTSPYFEITYIIQAFSLYQVGVCYLCFDNIFCIMCLHVAGQFRILQYRMANVSHSRYKKEHDKTIESADSLPISNESYAAFKNCIRQHQALIHFCATLEEIFRVIVLGQVLMFSILICFVGYQVLLVNLSLSWRVSFVSFLMTSICQLWMFTYSCDRVTRESANVASAVYAAAWTRMPMDQFGKMMRKDLQLVIMRARRPCCITASGFFPISLETYTKIMSTAMSYFTLLKESTVDVEET